MACLRAGTGPRELLLTHRPKSVPTPCQHCFQSLHSRLTANHDKQHGAGQVSDRTSPVSQHKCLYKQKQRHQVVATAAAALGAATQSGTWSHLLAIALGYCVLIGSCFRSVPQIVKIYKTGTTAGLSLTSNVVELLCYSVTLAYNVHHGFPFNTYGEVVACWLQDIILVILILKDMQMSGSRMLGSCLTFIGVSALLFWPGLCPGPVLGAMQLSTLFVLALGSRLPQILYNIKRGDAGVMSLTTCMMNVSGNIVRTFTTLTLTKDKLLLFGCITQGIMNSIILGQVIHTRLKAQAGNRDDTKQEHTNDDQPPDIHLRPQLA